MAIPVNVNFLELELTRNCNAKCLHCMRGNAQNKNMTKDIINNLFSNEDHEIKEIDELFITGGEPFYNKEAFLHLLDYILTHNILVSELESIINGTIYDKDIINLLKRLQKCGTFIYLETYKDQYHPNIPKNNLEYFLASKFYCCYEKHLQNKQIHNMGRAKEFGLGD